MRKPGPSPCHAVSLLLLATTALPAQQQFAELFGRHLPAWRGNVGRLALADVDNDGDLDLVLPVRGGPNRLWQNDGSGVFTDVTATHMPPGADEARAVAVADIDGDGDLDLAFANLGAQGRNRLYRNVGAGVFQDTTQSHLSHQDFPSTALQFVDVDGDGDQDLVVTGDATQLYANDGTGHFANVTATRLPASIDAQAAAFGDIDGDGDVDVDLVLARSAGAVAVVLGQGAAVERGHRNVRALTAAALAHNRRRPRAAIHSPRKHARPPPTMLGYRVVDATPPCRRPFARAHPPKPPPSRPRGAGGCSAPPASPACSPGRCWSAGRSSMPAGRRSTHRSRSSRCC